MAQPLPIPPERFLTERLLLRSPVPEDAEAIFRSYARDPEVTRYLVWSPHRDISETRAFLQRAAEARRSKSEFTWAITLRSSGELIGMIALRITLPRADFGYVVARPHWNRGYVTEAARTIGRWALDEEGIHRLWALCDVDNPASVRVLEKLGMAREGILRRWMYHAGSGVPRDCYCYAKIKGDPPL